MNKEITYPMILPSRQQVKLQKEACSFFYFKFNNNNFIYIYFLYNLKKHNNP